MCLQQPWLKFSLDKKVATEGNLIATMEQAQVRTTINRWVKLLLC